MIKSLMNKSLVHKTIYISLALQFITTLISLDGFRYKLNPIDNILKDILKIETVVQIIEGMVYLWISYSVSNLNVMIDRRYMDWTITTPLMLISTVLYMKYNTETEEYKRNVNLKDFFKDNSIEVLLIILLNGLMLLFGYLGEKNILDKNSSIIIGFAFFFGTFKYIYDKYVKDNDTNKKLFYFVFIVWSLYGVAAMFPAVSKNISYNFLDIVSKNFYGLFIYYKVLQVKLP